MINDLLSRLSCFEQDFIYQLISYQELRLCLDVGAAAGTMTKRIKLAGNEDTKVIGFEPFEGNHEYFIENTRSLKNIELVKKAASTQAGKAQFRILSTVKGNEKGWEKMPGYSSTGFLLRDESLVGIEVERNPTSADMQEFSVETVAIDNIVNGHVDFMKIDVQGGEIEVLEGCKSVIKNYGIDVMYIEFDGEKAILDFLSENGYCVFDTDYLLFSRKDEEFLQGLGFYDFRDLNLSTGQTVYRANLRLPDQEYCSFFKEFREKYGYIYTDLICVHENFLDRFLFNLCQYAASKSNSHPTQPTKKPFAKKNEEGLTSKLLKSERSASSSTSLSLAKNLLKRIANYYSRWTILVAAFALALNMVSLLDVPFGWLFLANGTALLLFLIGHAASKADYVLVEVEKLKKQHLLSLASQKKKKQET